MKKIVSLLFVLLMLMSFSGCGSFVPRSDSVYIKVYNFTGKSLSSIALNEYNRSVLKSTIVAQNADGSCYKPGESLIFEVLDAEPDDFSFVITATEKDGKSFVSNKISAARLCRGVIFSYFADEADGKLVLEYKGAES